MNIFKGAQKKINSLKCLKLGQFDKYIQETKGKLNAQKFMLI